MPQMLSWISKGDWKTSGQVRFVQPLGKPGQIICRLRLCFNQFMAMLRYKLPDSSVTDKAYSTRMKEGSTTYSTSKDAVIANPQERLKRPS